VMHPMDKFEDVIGKLCEILLPIKEDVHLGSKNSSIAICTLSNLKLLKQLVQTDILDDVALVGRLLSENRGIESLVRNTISNDRLKVIVLCGKDVWGHKSGHSLLLLHKYGVDENHRIRYSTSPRPFVDLSNSEIAQFQQQVSLIDKIGLEDPDSVYDFVKSL